jgi:DNA-binding NtrC family response regulator
MSLQRARLCLVEDDVIMGESLCDRFELEGFAVDWHQTGEQALQAIPREEYALVISDVRLPDTDGEAIFDTLRSSHANLPPFIFITAYGSIDKAVRLVKSGAADYVTKPFDLEHLLKKVQELVRPPLYASTEFEPRLGISAAMRRIQEMLPHLAARAGAVLVTGESGTGKEHVARLLHESRSDEDNRPFVAVNCGALTESLLEAELFGYEKGAFTGAVRTRRGVFEQAHGGTLLLDEIGEMPLGMQVRLLRAIQERCVVRVGGETPIPVQLSLVCATNRDLKKMVEDGEFREDLYYRINVVHIRVPPLRERKEDIIWFAEMFLREYAQKHPGERKQLHPLAEKALLDYPWPGNIRELKHYIERACIMTPQSELMPQDIFDEPHTASLIAASDAAQADDLGAYLRACERAYILRALEQHNWQMGETAQHLGISRKNLWEKTRKLGIVAQEASGRGESS